MLDSGGALGQRIADKLGRDSIENECEQLRLEAHDVRKGYCSRCAQVLIQVERHLLGLWGVDT